MNNTQHREYRILLIEDDFGLQHFIMRRMRADGYQVMAVSSGAEAIKELSDTQQEYDLVLLDYKLPDTNAEELVTEHWASLGSPPFIMLTGFGDERVAVQLMKLGAEDYIIKEADFIDYLRPAVERTLRHISQRDQLDEAQRQLKESEERLNLALHTAGIAVWDINLPEQHAYVCERWREISGQSLPRGPISLGLLHAVIHSEDRDYFQRRWSNFIRQTDSKRHFEAAFRIVHAESGDRWIENQGIVVLREPDGRPRRIICTFNDVTAKMRVREMEDQLRRAQRMDTLGSLAGGIAHDFNNVLAAIIGYNELTQRDPENVEFVLSNADHISRASQRAREIIRQVLLFSRLTNPEITKVDLVEVVNESVDFIRAVVAEHTLIETYYELDKAVIDADSGQISQVITNLLNNAAHAVKDVRGVIQVRIRETVSDQRNGYDEDRYGFFCVEVQDNGSGIPLNIQERIFEPFFSTKRKGEGTGLGLATSQGIIGSHGGRMTVTSEVGHGACFSVILPKARHSTVVKEKKKTTPVTPSALRILLVDDEIALTEVTTQLLILHGFEVDAYHDPVQALEYCKSTCEEYDLAICDYNMPHLNGDKLISILHEMHPQLPCVLVTGNMDQQQAKLTDIAPFTKLLRKPYSHEELMEVISEATLTDFVSQEFAE
ncbi:response regulator [Cerasicoccus arenae]|uniref:histidine kinase n=1 Tax=Cerasicoccus arenae TaxID=424488 RepID=A0A8J3DCF3_9BACT|nr:response regulator [Cerasicoccus arenae]MBK1859566.1 response regulator [Cerasicoccus arenae]GHC03071.1 hybrid sensor histidine kinase/response regulator [Cerasicoccus arenae]